MFNRSESMRVVAGAAPAAIYLTFGAAAVPEGFSSETIRSVVAFSQEFPSKPIRIVVPFPAGGSFDIMSRMLAQKMQLGQNVIVENRPGGGTVIGTEYVARQPDAHTLLCIGPSFTMHHALRSKVPFDTARDFKAVSEAIGLTMIVAVNASLPVKTIKEY